ncbi:MAG: S-layer homology domain-containing protein, partial [Firmicutes bacterium]|nr:S-layer homology domain-containing protein [Bacillota bacterium]
MIKRMTSVLLCIALVLGMTAAAFAGSVFFDITDNETAKNAEVLRLMGVIEGYGNGQFRPQAALSRAEFCKMAIYVLQCQDEAAKYENVTVFPDVKPSHWAASLINLSAKGKKIIVGYDDGYFRPNASVTCGQAVTILLRMLGYSDEEIGGVWPDSYMAQAKAIGLLDGVAADGRTAITRAQAAALFANLLTAETPDGGHLYTLTDEVIFKSISGGTKMNCSGGDSYTMACKITSSTLTGMTGQVVLNAKGKALT